MKKATKMFLVTTLSLTASVMMSSCDVTSVKDGFGGFMDSAVSSWAGEDVSNAIKDGFNGIVDTVGGWFGVEQEPENPEVKVTVTFDSYGGSAVESQEFTVGEDYELPTPTKDGYKFGGWVNGNVEVELNGEWTIAEDVTLTATWTAIRYTITYEGMEGVENSNPTTYTVEDADITLANPTKTGYEFKGWKLGEDVVTIIDTDTKTAITLTATWQAKTYTLTVDKNDGSETKEITVTYDQEYTLDDPTQEGYQFAGWYDEENNSFSKTPVWNFDKDVSLTAHWTSYIGFNFNGATSNTQVPDITIENGEAWDWSEYANIKEPTRTGYEFLGWFVGDVKVPISGDNWTYGKVTLKAEWKAIPYTITYKNLKDQTNTNPVSYTVADQSFTLADLADVTGYTFKGWEDEDGNAITIVNTDAETAKNRTLTAVWEAIPYEIKIVFIAVKTNETIETNEIIIPSDMPTSYTVDDADIDISKIVLSYYGWDFVGFYDKAEEGTEVTTIDTSKAEKITLYAYFKVSETVGWTAFY